MANACGSRLARYKPHADRGVRGTGAGLEAKYVAERNALRATHKLVQAALNAQHEEQRLQERRAFQALEVECLASHAPNT